MLVNLTMSDSAFTDLSPRRAMRPTVRTWIKHALFLLLTVFTATVASNIEPFGAISFIPKFDPQNWTEFLLLPIYYVEFIYDSIYLVFTNPALLSYGLKFSFSLLFILTCHEAGHYIACRLYGVDATLPYFIPTPPLIGPAGTLGAFIKILSPLPSRRATFDIGVAGPIAGFVALIPISIIGFLTMKVVPMEEITNTTSLSPFYFSDALFTKLLAYLFGIDFSLPIDANPFYFAAWIGLLVTALNLIPSGQLDGGHAVYAVLGEKIHGWTGKIAFVVMVLLSAIGLYFTVVRGRFFYNFVGSDDARRTS
ncbi:MAG: site-2 protease family protein [Blastocatellia bacterium]|nr:site-2 protease family protein [Blastocatellia bacterium]